MASVFEVSKRWNEGFANKDSSRFAELLTDDFDTFLPRMASSREYRRKPLNRSRSNG